jgi:hypothetical protein
MAVAFTPVAISGIARLLAQQLQADSCLVLQFR